MNRTVIFDPLLALPVIYALSLIAGLLALLALIATGGKDLALYGAAAGIAFYGMLLLLFMTSIAVLVFFKRDPQGGTKWKIFYAPLIAAIGVGVVLVTASMNIELLIDAPPAVMWGLVSLTYLSIIVGIVLAIYLKRRGSVIYDRIGRRID